MNKINIKFIFLTFGLFFILSFSFVNAEKEDLQDKKEKVEVFMPIEKDDFLLFYGTTKNKEINNKITNLRKNFTDKFEELKEEYKKDFYDIVSENELIPTLETIKEKEEETPTENTKITKEEVKKETTNTKATLNNTINTAKYIITESKSVLPNTINLINNKQETIKTESSSWFQKIKSFFKW